MLDDNQKTSAGTESFFNVDWEVEFEEEVTPKEIELLDRVAKKIVEVNMTAPAIMFLATVMPLNYLGSQLMLFLEPFTAMIFGFNELVTFRRALSKRETLEILVDLIEKADAEYLAAIRAQKGPSFWQKLKRRIFKKKNTY